MNVFQVLFWVVWSVYPVYLLHVLREARCRKKWEQSCAYCKHYQGCKELHQIIDNGIPLPWVCSGFERRDGAKQRKGWFLKKRKA